MKFTRNSPLKQLAPLCSSGFSAIFRPNRPIANMPTAILWGRRFRSFRHNPDGSLVSTLNLTDERAPMTREQYLSMYSDVLPKRLIMSLWILMSAWKDDYKIPERPWEFFTVGKVFICQFLRTIHSELLIYFIKVFSVLNTTRNDQRLLPSHLGNFQEVIYGELAYSSLYSYVVVDEVKGRDVCYCW